MCSLYPPSSQGNLEKKSEKTTMKRKREEDESEIRIAIEELSTVVTLKRHDKDDDDHQHNHDGVDASTSTTTAAAATTAAVAAANDMIAIRPFLSVCKQFIQLLDKIGPTMAVLRQDMHQNIQRLETLIDTDPSKYSNLIEILKKEKVEGSAKKITSCSKACLWLTRSMDFAVTLIQKLAKEPGENMEHAVEESYNVTLKPWHGWISTAAYKIAMKIVPENKTFISLLIGKEQNNDILNEDLQTLVSLLVPYLKDIFAVLGVYGLENLKAA